MKKTIMICLVLICLVASMAFALSQQVTTTAYALLDPSGAATQLTIKPSTNVTLMLESGVGGYAVAASHLNGDRVFGTSFDSQVIFWTAKTSGTQYTTAPAASNTSAFSGWSSL